MCRPEDPGEGTSIETGGTGPEEALPAAPARAPSFGRALAHRPFFLLWLSQLVSQSGDYVFEVALLWLVLQTTGSVFAVTLVVVATLVPAVLLGPVLGVYVDRWPRRTILLLTNVAEGVLVAALSGLVLAHEATLPLILGIVFALSVGSQFVRVTSNALVPQTVSADDLGPANSLLTFSNSSTQIVGLSIGGVVVALFGVNAPIAYDALSFLAAAAIVLFMASSVGRPEPAAEGDDGRFSTQFREGFRYVIAQRYLLEIIALGLVVNFAGNTAFALWAPYADLVLHGGAATYGLLGAMIAVGAIVGAIAIGKIDTRRRAGPILFAGEFAFGGLLIALGLTRSIPLALAESFGVGVLLSVINVPLFAAIQAKVPARLMGRVMSVLLALVLAAAPFGAFFAGTLATRTSIEFVYVVGGLLAIGSGVVGVTWMRQIRNLTY
ncbi:MAG TPA: MFS transporter [Thermoplasmata archaeon]|nr:MFS transporter [Thermoplasmata archaeon]